MPASKSKAKTRNTKKKTSTKSKKRVSKKKPSLKFKRKKKKATGLVDSILHLFHPRQSNNHRPKLLHPETLLYLVAIVLGIFALVNTFRYFPTLKDGVLGFASNITPAQVISLTNQERAKNGLAPVKANSLLNQAALMKAQDMFNKQYWAHTSPDGLDPWHFISQAKYSYRLAGENLARDFATTPEMLAAWMASPTHKANIINGKYTEIGVAVVDGVLEGFETTLVVQMFGTPKSQAAVVPTKAAAAKQVSVVEQKELVPAEDQPVAEQDPQEVESAQQPVTIEPSAGQEEDLVAFIADEQLQLEVSRPDLEEPSVLAGALIPVGRLTRPPLFTPLQITKALFLSVIILILMTLIYDAFVIGHYKTARLVGQNLAHIIFLSTVAFLLIFFKGGMIN